MGILDEKEAFLNVYVIYKDDSRKITFNEETEQFMWRKNNISDTEVEYVHLMNQRWYAWLACAKSKAQAVPEGFVLVPRKLTHHQAVKISDDENFFEIYQTILTESDTSEDSAAILIQAVHSAMIEAGASQ